MVIRHGCVTAGVGIVVGLVVVAQIAGGIGALVVAMNDLFVEKDWLGALGATFFAALFGSVGFTLLTAIIVARWRKEPATTMNSEVPDDAPWLENPDWTSRRVPAMHGATLFAPVLGVVALWWNVATLPLLATLPMFLRGAPGHSAWLALATPVPGLLLVAAFLYQFLRSQKFGLSVFELASVPGVVGGQLAGVVRIPARLQAVEGFRLRLTCSESRNIPKGDGTETVFLWQDERVIMQPLREAKSTCVPVLFAIPFSVPETSRRGSERDIDWRLEVWASLAGIDYSATFAVPVFKTAASRADFQVEADLAADYFPPPSGEMVLREAGIVREPLEDGGVRLTFKAARNWRVAIFVSLFPLVFFPIAFAMLKYDKTARNFLNVPKIWSAAAKDGDFIAYAFAAGRTMFVVFIGFVASAVSLLILAAAIDLWLYRSVVEASPLGLSVRGGWLGVGRPRWFAADDIQKLKAEVYMSSSGGSVWKSILVVPKKGRGKKRTLGRAVAGKLAQEAVLDELNTALGRTA